MKKSLSIAVLITISFSFFHCGTSTTFIGAPVADPVLTDTLRAFASRVQGEVGIYVRNLRTGQMAAVNADTLFPTASLIKVPIMVGLFDRIEKGGLKYQDELMYRDSMSYSNEDMLGVFKDSSKIPVSQLVMLSLTMSDNTASLWCQALAGGGAAINDVLEANGFHKTRVNSRTPGREAIREVYGWGHTTPREMAELVAAMRVGKLISAAASERMYRNLCRTYWDGEALAELPPDVHAASKQGMVNKSRSEVVLVNAPSGDYVFCVITKNQKDESWTHENEGYVLRRAVSRFLWKYFEPGMPWSPLQGVEKWY